MRTIQFEGRLHPDCLVMRESPTPTPGPREVLVRVRAVALNYRDVAIASGNYASYALPLVPCSDAAGEIVSTGPQVRRWQVSDRVCPAYVPEWRAGPVQAPVTQRRLGGPNDGVLREYVCLHEDEVVRVPAHLTYPEAATLPVAGVTAWQALMEDARVRAGEVVGVLGTGGVSLFALQLARVAGARVVLIGRNATKLAKARALGAEVVDSSRESAWHERVLDLTDGQGVDVFFDVVGGEALARAVEATRVGGTLCSIGFVGDSSARVQIPTLLRRALTIRAASGGSRASFEALVRALETHALRPVIDRSFAFDLASIRAAFSYLASAQAFGKVVIDLGVES